MYQPSAEADGETMVGKNLRGIANPSADMAWGLLLALLSSYSPRLACA